MLDSDYSLKTGYDALYWKERLESFTAHSSPHMVQVSLSALSRTLALAVSGSIA